MTPSCVTPQTPVGGSLVVGVKAFYAGALVELQFASGCVPLVVTPGTPVATRTGFVRAEDIAVGASVLRVAGMTPEPTAQDAFFTLHGGTHQREREPVPVDFMGDGEYIHGAIRHVYPTRGPLRIGCSATLDYAADSDPWSEADHGKAFVDGLAKFEACAWDAVTAKRTMEHSSPDPEDGCFVYDFVSTRRWYCAAGVVVANSVANVAAEVL